MYKFEQSNQKSQSNFRKKLLNSLRITHKTHVYKYISKFKEQDVYCIDTLKGRYICVTEPNLINQLLKYPRLSDGEILSEGRQLRVIADALGKYRLNAEKKDMKNKRSVMAELMAKPQRYLPKMIECSLELINTWKTKVDKPFSITKDIAKYTAAMFLKPVLGYQGPLQPIANILEEQIDLLGKHLVYETPKNFNIRFIDLRNQLMSYLYPKKFSVLNQSASVVANSLNKYIKSNDKLANIEQEAFATGVNGGTLAGYLAPNPTFNAIVYELAKNSEWQNLLYKECLSDPELEKYVEKKDSLLNAFVHEVMRLHPAQPFLFRNVEKNFFLDDRYAFNKGDQLIIDIYNSMKRYKIYGQDSNKFNPIRFFDNEELYRKYYLVYSNGPNNCTGQFYSRLCNKVLVSNLVKNFQFYQVNEVAHKFHFALQFSDDIKIIIKPRKAI